MRNAIISRRETGGQLTENNGKFWTLPKSAHTGGHINFTTYGNGRWGYPETMMACFIQTTTAKLGQHLM